MVSLVNFVTLALALTSYATAFPAHQSLAGLSKKELGQIIPTLEYRQAPDLPPRMEFNGTKLVNDDAHPWQLLRDGDIRGPCPGLNTLASHGVRDVPVSDRFVLTLSLLRHSISRVMVSLHLIRLSLLFRKVSMH
jgi:hypothetical protein